MSKIAKERQLLHYKKMLEKNNLESVNYIISYGKKFT